MTDDTLLPFSFPAIRGKKITAAFDGGRITSDGGVMVLAAAERRLGLADKLASVICDPRDPGRVTHGLADMLRARIFAIACGFEDANDLDRLRTDPAFKLACGRLPDSGVDLCSQPTCSRAENLADLRTVIRLGEVLVDLWLSSYADPPASVTLDIDDTLDVVHGHQQLSLFNAHHDERRFVPIHLYDAETGRPVAIILRPGKTPTGKEIRGHLRRLLRRIRARWPATRILVRGDSHYGRAEVMAWCEGNGVDYVFGLPGNQVLQRLVDETADDIRIRSAKPPLLIVNTVALQAWDREILESLPVRLLPQDEETIRATYAHYWDQIYLAGRQWRDLAAGEHRSFEIVVPGDHTLIASGSVIVNGETFEPWTTIRLDEGPHELRTTSAEPDLRILWGTRLKPLEDLPPSLADADQ